MIKKSKKISFLAFMVFFASITSASAKELTKDGLQSEILDKNPKANAAYVIGSHVFTTNYSISIEEFMKASNSIVDNTEEDDLSNMIISLAEFEKGSDFVTIENFILDSTLTERFAETGTINITMIDGKKLIDGVNTDDLVDKAIVGVNEDLFAMERTGSEIVVTIENPTQKLSDVVGSKIVTMLQELVANDDVESVVFSADGVASFTYTSTTKASEILQWFKDNSNAIFGKAYDKVLNADLLTKTFDATIKLVDKTSQNGNPEEIYTITFDAEEITVNTDDMVNTALGTQTLFKDKATLDDKTGTITVQVSTNEASQKITEGMGSGILEALQNLVNNNDAVESIVFAIDGEDYTFTKETTLTEVKTWLTNSGLSNATVKDLIGKTVTANIILISNAENKGNNEEYIINFINVLEKSSFESNNDAVKQIKKEVYDVNIDGTKITVKAMNPTSTVYQSASGAGIRATIENFINQEVIDKIVITLGGENYEFDAEEVAKGEGSTILSTLAEGFAVAAGLGNNISSVMGMTNEDLFKVTGTTITVYLSDGNTFEDGTNKIDYTLTIVDGTTNQ